MQPKGYAMLVTILENSEAEWTISEVQAKLMTVEQRVSNEEVAFFARGRRNDKQQGKPKEGKPKECWYCHKVGHIEAHCYQKKRDEQRGDVKGKLYNMMTVAL
jgi:hypothetical protein